VRSVLVVKDSPFPARSGSPLRNWQTVNLLREFGPVSVFSIGEADPNVSEIPGVEAWEHIDAAPPAAHEKFRRLLHALAHLVRPQEYPHVAPEQTRAVARRLSRFIERQRPDLLVLANWQQRFPRALAAHAHALVLDAHNVESSLAREAVPPGLPILSRVLRAWRLRRFREFERELLAAPRQVWVCSERDCERVKGLCPSSDVRVIPNAIDLRLYDAARTPLARGTRTLCYVGLFSYDPNAAAADLLIQRILPRVRERFPDAKLLLVGRHPTQSMLKAAAEDPSITVTGEVDDVRPFLESASATIVPLAHGGGTRLKILEAFASNLPVVSTTKGCEGIAAQEGEHVLIRNEPEALADAVCALWADPALAARLAQNARELVASTYSWDAARRPAAAALDALLPGAARA
jgi:glycosyltransferase involved in cell wall biosynthesis